MIETAFPNATPVRGPIQFTDVPSRFWATRPIQTAYQTGFLTGYAGQVFDPDRQIPRVQVLVALAGGLKYKPSKVTPAILNELFDDAATIPEYARSAIAAATEKRLVVNYPNVRTLNPNQLATRAEVATLLCQALMGQDSSVPTQYIARSPVLPASEIRGVWLTNIDSDVLFSSQKIASAMQRLDRLNFNTVYPTVWNWGYTLYPSQVAKRVTGRAVRLVTPIDESLDPDLGVKGRDMLKEFVEIGKQKGIRVMPWFEFGFMAPGDSELAKRNPKWITKRRDGTQVKMEGIHPRVWLNPFHPEVQKFIIDLIVEVVSNYDVDGIQLDDHLGLPAEYGYDEYTVELYKKEHKGKLPPDDPKDAAWTRWRADKITDFKARLFQAVKARKPKCIVALSPNPQEFSYQEYLADWQTWERRGLVEEIIVQVYRNDLSRFISDLEHPSIQAARRHVPVGIGILAGLKGRPVSMEQIQEQVQVVRDKEFAGVSFFFYESMWKWADEPTAQRESGFAKIFPEPVDSPNLVQGWTPPQ